MMPRLLYDRLDELGDHSGTADTLRIHAALVHQTVREAAVAMGMTDGQVLRQVELPLAMGVIVTGVRVATVIAVGVTTIAAAVGAGGVALCTGACQAAWHQVAEPTRLFPAV